MSITLPSDLAFSESISLLLEDYGNYLYRVRNCASRTVEDYIHFVKKLIFLSKSTEREDFFCELSFESLQTCVIAYTKNSAPGSYNGFYSSVRSFLKYCWIEGYTKNDLSPAVPVLKKRKLSSLPKSIPPECTTALFETIDDSMMPGIRDMAIIRMLVAYGVRGVHVRRLKLAAIDWDSEIITFPATKEGKKISQPLTTDVGNALLNYLRNGRPPSDRPEVFLSSLAPFRPMEKSSTLTHLVARYLSLPEVALPERVPKGTHCFRHAFATRLTGKVPMKHVSDMLGHRDISSTFIYSKVDLAALRETAQIWPEAVWHE